MFSSLQHARVHLCLRLDGEQEVLEQFEALRMSPINTANPNP